jgi:hypothetical protein
VKVKTCRCLWLIHIRAELHLVHPFLSRKENGMQL